MHEGQAMMQAKRESPDDVDISTCYRRDFEQLLVFPVFTRRLLDSRVKCCTPLR